MIKIRSLERLPPLKLARSLCLLTVGPLLRLRSNPLSAASSRNIPMMDLTNMFNHRPTQMSHLWETLIVQAKPVRLNAGLRTTWLLNFKMTGTAPRTTEKQRGIEAQQGKNVLIPILDSSLEAESSVKPKDRMIPHEDTQMTSFKEKSGNELRLRNES